jgi:hypothetical protein
MTKVITLNYLNKNYKPKFETVISEDIDTETGDIIEIKTEKLLPLSDEEVFAAKNDANYKKAALVVKVLNDFGCNVSLNLDNIRFVVASKDVVGEE